MNTFSHVLISGIVNRYIKEFYGIKIHKLSFVYGNIIPDYASDYKEIPHYKLMMPNFIQDEVNALTDIEIKNTADFDKNLSFRLGVVCHYLADFFCYAHSPNFNGNVFKHIKYEFLLGKYNRKKKKILKTLDFLNPEDVLTEPRQLIDRLEQMYLEYLDVNHSYGMDILYTVQVCVQLVVSVCTILREKDPLFRFDENTAVFNLSNKA